MSRLERIGAVARKYCVRAIAKSISDEGDAGA
jgi:hypothetical protein